MAVIEKLEYNIKNLDNASSSDKSVDISLKLPKANFRYLLHRAVVVQDNRARKGNACTKTRSEVRAGGKKPWKQKGTGQARSGSKNSPLWSGGGVAFGPKPRSYNKKINNKEWRLALQTALYSSTDKITIVENFVGGITEVSTKNVIKKLEYVTNLKTKTLLIVKEVNTNLSLSTRNIDNLTLLYSNKLNVKDILMARNIIITEDGLKNIQEIYHD